MHKIRVPHYLNVQRADRILRFTCDTAQMDIVDVQIGYKMRVGFFIDVFKITDTGRVIIEHGDASGEDVTRVLSYVPKIDSSLVTPAHGVEIALTFFETDIPEQHMWNPRAGRKYSVLWTKTFTTSHN